MNSPLWLIYICKDVSIRRLRWWNVCLLFPQRWSIFYKLVDLSKFGISNPQNLFPVLCRLIPVVKLVLGSCVLLAIKLSRCITMKDKQFELKKLSLRGKLTPFKIFIAALSGRQVATSLLMNWKESSQIPTSICINFVHLIPVTHMCKLKVPLGTGKLKVCELFWTDGGQHML